MIKRIVLFLTPNNTARFSHVFPRTFHARFLSLSLLGCLMYYETTVRVFAVQWILCTPKKELLAEHTAEHFFRNFPDAETASRMLGTSTTKHPHFAACELCSMSWFALALEKMGLLERALEYATVGLWTDFERGGVKIRWAKSICHGCIGRILRAQGQLDEAAVAFDRAFAACAGVYTFFEALALRDWKTVVPAGSAKAIELDLRFTETIAKLGHDSKEKLEQRVATCFVFDLEEH